MDVVQGGVYDSPMAQDYYVKRFGFMFGGCRSWMYGLHWRISRLRLGCPEAIGDAGSPDEEQHGHVLQERPPHCQDHLLQLQQVQKPALVEGKAHDEARPQEDGQHLLQHLHGGP